MSNNSDEYDLSDIMYSEGKGNEQEQYYKISSKPSGYSSASAAHDEGPGKWFVPDLQAALEAVERKQTEAEVIQGTHCCLCRKPLAGDEKLITAHGTIFYGSFCRHTLHFNCYAGWFSKLHKNHWPEGFERDFNLRDQNICPDENCEGVVDYATLPGSRKPGRTTPECVKCRQSIDTTEDVWVKFDHVDEPPLNKFICDDSTKRLPELPCLGYAHSKCYDQIKAPYVRRTNSTDRSGSVVRCPKCARLVSYSRVFSKSAAPISIIKRTRPSISSVSSMGVF